MSKLDESQIILVILFLVLVHVLVRGWVGGHEPYEAQPGTEGVGVVQGGSPVSPWYNNGEGKRIY